MVRCHKCGHQRLAVAFLFRDKACKSCGSFVRTNVQMLGLSVAAGATVLIPVGVVALDAATMFGLALAVVVECFGRAPASDEHE